MREGKEKEAGEAMIKGGLVVEEVCSGNFLYYFRHWHYWYIVFLYHVDSQYS